MHPCVRATRCLLYTSQADIYSKYGYDNVKRFIDSLGARATTEDPRFTGKLASRWQADSALASMVEAAKETGTNMGIAPMPAPAEGGEGQGMLSCGCLLYTSRCV